MTDLTVSPAFLWTVSLGLIGAAGTLAVTVYRSVENGRAIAALTRDLASLTAAHHALELRVVASEGALSNVLAAIGDVKASIEKLSDKLDRLRDEQ